MKRWQYLILGVAVAALLVSVVVFKRHLPYTGMPALPKQPPAVVLTMRDTYLVGLAHGAKLWTLRADKVEVAQNRSTTILIGIRRGEVYSAGKVAFSVKAGRAIYDSVYRSLALSRGLQIKGQGQQVVSDGAVWNPETAILCSTGPVTYSAPWGRLRAERLELNLRNRQMSLTRVGGSFDLKNAGNAFQIGTNETTN
jgi:lipopolysaccharide export system protein LptC